MKRIIVIGSTNVDMVVRTSNLPKAGETILGSKFLKNLGGKGANQAIAASRLGGNVKFITSVGDDDFGKDALKNLEKEGIETSHVLSNFRLSTGIALITIAENGENSIVVSPGANSALKPEHISLAEEDIKNSDLVLLQLEIPIDSVEHTIKLAKKHRKKIILNPAPARDISDDIISSLYAITPNELEAQFLTGIKINDQKSAESAADILLSKGVEVVIITMGSHGVYVQSDDYRNLFPVRPVKVVDTTAAGDTFNGALGLALASGKSLKSAVEFSNVCASLSVTKFGAQASMPQIEEVEAVFTNMESKSQ